jgi:hypothetical protein
MRMHKKKPAEGIDNYRNKRKGCGMCSFVFVPHDTFEEL